MLIMLGQLSNELWTLCLVPTKTTDPLQTGEPWRSYLGYSSPKRKHTLITPSSRQAIIFLYLSECNLRFIDYWLIVWAHEHIAHEWWGYWDCIFLGLCKSQGIWSGGFRHVHIGYKRFSQMLVGVLAKRRLCLGPAGVINCAPLSALSFWVSLIPGTCGYNIRRKLAISTANVLLTKLFSKWVKQYSIF